MKIPDLTQMSLADIFAGNKDMADQARQLVATLEDQGHAMRNVCGFTNYMDSGDTDSSGMQ